MARVSIAIPFRRSKGRAVEQGGHFVSGRTRTAKKEEKFATGRNILPVAVSIVAGRAIGMPLLLMFMFIPA
jgi:hypothetical protein